jgi:hypothetical protein
MFSWSIIDGSRTIHDTSRVVRMMIVSDATTYYCHARGIIYDCNILIIQATDYIRLISLQVREIFITPSTLWGGQVG